MLLNMGQWVAAGRAFIKVLRYDLPADKTGTTAIFTDTVEVDESPDCVAFSA